jgi:hypothetical protein
MLKKNLDYWYREDPLYNRKLRLLKKAACPGAFSSVLSFIGTIEQHSFGAISRNTFLSVDATVYG